MRWKEIRGFIGLLSAIVGQLKGRKAKKFARRLELYAIRADRLYDIRSRWKEAEDNNLGLTLTADEVSYLKQIREKAF